METLGQLGSRLAHEVNNQITLMMGKAALIQATPDLPAPLGEDLGQILKAGEKVTNLTRQWLSLGCKNSSVLRQVEVNSLIKELAPMFRAALNGGIRLLTDFDPEPTTVVVDPGLLEQILINLVLNARDAMAQSGVLTLRTARVLLKEEASQLRLPVAPGSYVALSVQDTGCGMENTTLAKIFQPFFTTKGPGKGTGMGLCTVWDIAKESGGGLQVVSTPGQGTTFTVFLPLVCEKEGTKPLDHPDRPTVLMVGGDEPIRYLVREILSREGCQVRDTRDFVEAEHYCRQRKTPINLLILDTCLPGTSQEIVCRLRTGQRPFKVLHLVHPLHDPQERDNQANSDQVFLTKPFLAGALVSKVRELLGSPKGRMKVEG
jgi:CheY-like chemotaxis protein